MIIVDICGDDGKIIELKYKHVRIHSFFIRISKNRLSLKCYWGFGISIFFDVLKFLPQKSLNALCSYFFGNNGKNSNIFFNP